MTNFGVPPRAVESLMESNGMYASFNMPTKLQSRIVGGEEIAHGLPPYAPRKAFLVDEYPACPADWMRSEGKAHSYFVPVKEDYGMWLDFNGQKSPYDIACVVSVQGINAITGMPVDNVYLEQYVEKCPKHDLKFGPHRFCEKCDYRWPKQNYLSSTGTPNGYFWLDGFRAADGIVRQYILTAEKMKGVANAVIGKDRVFAVGISFFLSKEKRKQPEPSVTRSGYAVTDAFTTAKMLNVMNNVPATTGIKTKTVLKSSRKRSTAGGASAGMTKEYNPALFHSMKLDDGHSFTVTSSNSAEMDWMDSSLESADIPDVDVENARGIFLNQTVEVSKKLEVGQGAKISQLVYDDPCDIDFWRKEPESILYVNYCLEVDAEKIIAAGRKDLKGKEDGFLAGIPKSV